eukprot:SAG22_NODE_477_length_9978_cov_2.807268_15_plen_42_part_00
MQHTRTFSFLDFLDFLDFLKRERICMGMPECLSQRVEPELA